MPRGLAKQLFVVVFALCGCARATPAGSPLGRGYALTKSSAEGRPEPLLWRRPPLRQLEIDAMFDADTVEVAREKAALVVSPDVGESYSIRVDPLAEASVEVDRGFMTRLAFDSPTAAKPIRQLYVEVFRGSPLVSVFRREPADAPPSLELVSELDIDTVYAFNGDRLVETAATSVWLSPNATSKPVVGLYDSRRRLGLVLFFPQPPELRDWSELDYLVRERAGLSITIQRQAEGSTIRVAISAAGEIAGEELTAELSMMVLAHAGSFESALAPLELPGFRPLLGHGAYLSSSPEGLWALRPEWDASTPYDALRFFRMFRYFPREFMSWIDANEIEGGRREGYTWTLTTKLLKGVRAKPLSPRPLERDMAFRILSFFLDAGAEKGAPPHFAPHSEWARLLGGEERLRTVVFCQYWEFTLGAFRDLMRSDYLEESEKDRVYEELQRAKVVFDPRGPHTWTSTTPEGGVWFDYFDLPLYTPHRYIFNTHTTSVGNVGEFALLARERGRADDFEYWRDLFQRGIDGLLYATSQPWAFSADDPNRLNYSSESAGPDNYHRWMVEAWLPRVIALAEELAPDRVSPLRVLLDRLQRSKVRLDRPNAVG